MIQGQISELLRTEEQNTPNDPIHGTEHMTGAVHWTHYKAKEPRPGAKTLVLVHGAGHNELVWTLGPTNWVGYFTRLGHDVLTVSLRGHRPSKGLVTFQTMQQYLCDAYTPVEALGLDDQDVVYIGHSMGGIVVQMLLARKPQLAGVVVVDSIAPHRAFAQYVPFLKWLSRRHPLTFLATLLNPAAMFGSDALVRELLVGNAVSHEVVTALRRTLGGETCAAMLEVLRLQRKGCQRLDGHKLLFISAEESVFFPPAACEACAREQGAAFVQVPGKHNLMLTPSAPLAASAIEAFISTLPTERPPDQKQSPFVVPDALRR